MPRISRKGSEQDLRAFNPDSEVAQSNFGICRVRRGRVSWGQLNGRKRLLSFPLQGVLLGSAPNYVLYQIWLFNSKRNGRLTPTIAEPTQRSSLPLPLPPPPQPSSACEQCLPSMTRSGETPPSPIQAAPAREPTLLAHPRANADLLTLIQQIRSGPLVLFAAIADVLPNPTTRNPIL
jgi:hypothetical protein